MRVNHVTKYKTASNMFLTDADGTITTHKGTEYLEQINRNQNYNIVPGNNSFQYCIYELSRVLVKLTFNAGFYLLVNRNN